jgi:hypothetical protein
MAVVSSFLSGEVAMVADGFNGTFLAKFDDAMVVVSGCGDSTRSLTIK